MALNAISYNVQALKTPDRLGRILRETKKKKDADVVALQGKLWKHNGRDCFYTSEGYRVMHWPYTQEKAADLTNKHAGVALALEGKKFPMECTQEVFNPPERLQGRGGQ